MKKINVKCFWRGTIVYDVNLTQSAYNKTVEFFKQDFFEGCEETIDSAIQWLDGVELEYATEYKLRGQYTLRPLREQIQCVLIINSLIMRGLAQNDDMTGLLTSISKA